MDNAASAAAETLAPGTTEVFAAVFFTFVAAFFLVLGYMDVLRRRSDIKRRAVLDQSRACSATLSSRNGSAAQNRFAIESLSATSALLSDVERRSKEKENRSGEDQAGAVESRILRPKSVLWYQSIRLTLLGSFVLIAIIAMNAMAAGSLVPRKSS